LKTDINFSVWWEARVIVCLCEGVNDRTLRDAVREGACTVGALVRRTKAGTNCGSCACDVKRVLCEENERAARERGLPLAAK
jgi:bacterioferritin-associated ferredoxin